MPLALPSWRLNIVTKHGWNLEKSRGWPNIGKLVPNSYLEKCVWPLQPGRTQRRDRAKAAPEVYAGEQRTRGQQQAIWCLEDKATGRS